MRRYVAGLLAIVMLAAVGCSGNQSAPQTGGSTNTNTNTGSTGGSEAKEQVIRMNIGTNPETIDPRLSTGLPEAHVEIALFEGLMRLDAEGKAIPGVAENVKVNEDNTVFTFKIRDNAKWSNGDPVTAHDFVWSWKSTLDPLLASEYAYQLYYIKGAQAMNEVPVNQVDASGKEIQGADGKPVPRSNEEIKADFEKAAENFGAKALDDKTLEVTLEAPTPYFLSLTAFHSLYPVHRPSVEANPEAWFRDPATTVGNGPFKLVSWTDKDKVIVEKNPNYWGKDEVKLDKIEFYLVEEESVATQMFENGELDVVESGVNKAELERLKADYPDELKILPDLGLYYYLFNTTREPLNDARVRQALALAIDRKAIVENVTKAGEMPAYSVVPGGIPDVTGDFRQNGGDFFQEDVAKAKQLLAEAGYPDGKGFPTLTILYNTSEAHKRIGEAIQEMWKQNLGIDVQLTNQEWGVYLDSRQQLNYDIARAGWIGDYIDPMTFIDLFVTGGGNNHTGWSNKQYDELVQNAKLESDPAKRMQQLHDAEKIVMEEMPIMPIYHYTRPVLVSKKVQNWSMPLTSPLNLRDASIN